jgi:hypothetical protein
VTEVSEMAQASSKTMSQDRFSSVTALAFFVFLGACTTDLSLGAHAPASENSPAQKDDGGAPSTTTGVDAGGESKDPKTTKDASPPSPPIKTRSWTTRSPMPTKRTRLSAVFTNGKLYAIGGFAFNGPSAAVEIYDLANDSWSVAPSMSTARYGAAAVVRPDGKIVVMGGDYDSSTSPSSVGHSNVVEVLDPTTGEWTSGPTLPEGRYQGRAAVRADGTIVFAGGLAVPPGVTRASVFTLAPGSNVWANGPTMTSPRTSHALVAGADGSIYAIGGKNNQGDDLASVETLGPSALGFATLSAMPATLSGHAAVRGADGTLVVVGGGSGASPLVFDPSTKAWSSLPAPPASRLYAAAAAAPDGTVVLVGGEAGMALDDLYTLSP